MKQTLQASEILALPLSFGRLGKAMTAKPISQRAQSFRRRVLIGLRALVNALAEDWRRAEEIHRRLEERKRSDYLRYGPYSR